MKKMNWLIVLMMIGLVFFSACSSKDAGDNTDTGKAEEDSNGDKADVENDGEKVKLTIAYEWGEEAFNKRYKPIEEYLGNVELEYVASNGTLEGFEEMFAKGIKPDIFVDQNITALQDMDLIYYMDELIEQEDFDLDMLDQSLVNSLRAYDKEKRLVGLPDGTTTVALYYNKEIFDLFGEPYPDPDKPMKWPEVMDLARKMTQERDGIQYIGLDTALFPFILNQFAATATDPETGEVLINKEAGFKKYFDLMANYYSIPGIQNTGEDDPFSQKRAAMSLRNNIYLDALAGEDEDMEFIKPYEMVPFPVWPELPNVGPTTGTTPMIIANYSEHKAEAMEVLKTYFLPEILLEHVRSGGTNPPVSDPEIYSQYAKDLKAYEGKNLDAYYALEKAVPEFYSRWDEYVDIDAAVTKIAEGGDVVSVMRELEEESKVKIEEAMASN